MLLWMNYVERNKVGMVYYNFENLNHDTNFFEYIAASKTYLNSKKKKIKKKEKIN